MKIKQRRQDNSGRIVLAVVIAGMIVLAAAFGAMVFYVKKYTY